MMELSSLLCTGEDGRNIGNESDTDEPSSRRKSGGMSRMFVQ
jgi:hypothetical protein